MVIPSTEHDSTALQVGTSKKYGHFTSKCYSMKVQANLYLIGVH